MILQAGVCLEQRYRLIKVIGKGGTSTVFLALDEKIQRKRAVKAVKKDRAEDTRLWKQECEMLKRLHHEYLAEIYDVLEDDEYVFLVMEYVEGYSVKELRDMRYQFSVDQVAAFGIQICQVLSYLHGQNPPIIYRDLKPSNLIMRPDRKIVLIDFGTAREYQKNKEEDTVFWGTVGYASPEQMEGWGQTDARSDIYSLGVTLYEMAYGEKFSRALVEYPDTALEEIIEKCTRIKPEERYRTAEELAVNLENRQLLGKKNKRRFRRKKRVAVMIWSIVMLLFSVSGLLRWQSGRLLTEGYEKYLTAGERATKSRERILDFQSAVSINPWKPEGYFALLDEYRSQGFGQEAYLDILELLNRKTENGAVYEDCLKQSPEEYARFAYQMGAACYFEWEGYGNKKYARPWLQEAVEKEGLTDEEKELAVCLEKIAGYYEVLKAQTEGQTGNISYGEYWEDLKKLLELPGNEATRQLVEKEAASQILCHVQDFFDCGIEKEELTGVLAAIREDNPKLETIISEGEKFIELIYSSPL